MSTTTDERMWDVQRLSDFLGLPVSTLYQWRYLGKGPKGYKVGRHVRYLPEEIYAWVREQS
ncbi:helix-turn-helix domain-containing protein [Streptosporangium sp. NPDC023615]|uniref:helix-turn-helix transcriptional regulator n=1 Tax=Streptosporangium sp. NPDC023615 TaxID=3154794 RepID=UPI00341CE736